MGAPCPGLRVISQASPLVRLAVRHRLHAAGFDVSPSFPEDGLQSEKEQGLSPASLTLEVKYNPHSHLHPTDGK